jgi:hypothetical protein
VLDQPEPKGALKQIHVPVNYVHANGRNYVVVADVAVRGLANIKPPHGVTPVPDKSYFFARYAVRGNQLDIYQIDSARAAKLVIDGKLDGTVDKTQNELHVYVRGTRANMLDIVQTQPIFDEKPFSLKRSRLSLEDYEKAAIAAPERSKR